MLDHLNSLFLIIGSTIYLTLCQWYILAPKVKTFDISIIVAHMNMPSKYIWPNELKLHIEHPLDKTL